MSERIKANMEFIFLATLALACQLVEGQTTTVVSLNPNSSAAVASASSVSGTHYSSISSNSTATPTTPTTKMDGPLTTLPLEKSQSTTVVSLNPSTSAAVASASSVSPTPTPLEKGANFPTVDNVTCHNSLTVDITITNVNAGWNATVVRQSDKNTPCEADDQGHRTVMFSGLTLPNCASFSKQLNNSIKYTLEISVTKSESGITTQYDQMLYVSCEYVNSNKTMTNFVPVKYGNKTATSESAFFIFKLSAFSDVKFTKEVSKQVKLNTTLYFRAWVQTKSVAPNLDLFPVHCWSSQSYEPASDQGKKTLINDGCGPDKYEEIYDLLSYNCANDSASETFSIRTFRYTGANEDAPVYFHCDLRVCLADLNHSKCHCPDCNRRKRRSLADEVDETKVYHASTGPFIFKNDKEEEEEEESGEPQSFPTNLAVTVTVSGVAALAIICVTAYLVVRNCSKRRQHGDLNVAT